MIKPQTVTNRTPAVVPFGRCPAKTYLSEAGIRPGRSVEDHCLIVSAVASELISRLPIWVADALFPSGSGLVAGAHDIGKVSPTFFNKIARACSAPLLPDVDPDLEKNWGGHAGVSEATLLHTNAPAFVAQITGQHHGFSPPITGKRGNAEIFGGDAWYKERLALVGRLKSATMQDWPRITSDHQARVIAGLTSVSDWIGSGRFFENPDIAWSEDLIKQAVDDAGFFRPTYRPELTFSDVFGFSPRDSQSRLIEQVKSPGVYILEAPMGMGKTEAALFAAYNLLRRGDATGVYFALPTQLTSNKIHERFSQFLGQIIPESSSRSALLLHGNAWLLNTEMGEDGRPGGNWFSHAKRGLLAPFAVGTIDQALMATMNVKHGFVRSFGLAGKVVILDEVHTYDSYTGTILDALVDHLRNLHCTIIILSATLSKERRERLLKHSVQCSDYPLISALAREDTLQEVPVRPGTDQTFNIYRSSDRDALEEAIRRAESGELVLWIENTVKEAQSRYLDLAARASDLHVDCGLLHSRFTTSDRQKIEDRWVSAFGKSGWTERGRMGRILVGTQVLEQSLDIDADFLISRFAPTDMLLQRLGRLWRHADTPRHANARPDVWLLAPTIDEALAAPEQQFGSSAFVYSPYVLCRSLEQWEQKASIALPGEIRPMIESTYQSREEGGRWTVLKSELDNGTRGRKGRIALANMARITLSKGGKTLPENLAQTRYGDTECRDVLLLKDVVALPERNATQLTLLNETTLEIPHKRNQLTKEQWKTICATLMSQVVSVQKHQAPEGVSIQAMQRMGLHHCFYLGNPDWADEECLLRVGLVTEEGDVTSHQGQSPHKTLDLTYRSDLGYVAQKQRSTMDEPIF